MNINVTGANGAKPATPPTGALIKESSDRAFKADVIDASLEILGRRFAQDQRTEGFRKDGPVAVARFELGEGNEAVQREARAVRQRQASDLIERLLVRIG